MTKHQEIIAQLRFSNPPQAEFMEEEIDIMIHKLKFLSSDNFPKTLILNQANEYEALFDSVLQEKIQIAGGQLINDIALSPDCLIFIQTNDSLYSDLPQLINDNTLSQSGAIKNNNVYVIPSTNFNQLDENYLLETEILAEIQQPKYFFFGKEGEGWLKFNLQ